jgi:glycerophosphoryl diester phosphodiesterase
VSTQLIAHRGASAEAPENTLNAIRQAITLNVDWIEVDIHLSKDGVPVVIHDRAIPQIITGTHRKYIDTLTLEEIKQLDCGSWFSKRFANERIPTLHEVLFETFGKTSLMIEIKHGKNSPSQMAKAVIEVIKNCPTLPMLKIASFSLEIIQEIQKAAPNLPVMGIVERFPMVHTFLNKDIMHLAIWYKLLNPKTIHDLVDNGVQIWSFTIDSLPKAQHFLSEGVQGIITNHPRKLLPLFKNKKALLENS